MLWFLWFANPSGIFLMIPLSNLYPNFIHNKHILYMYLIEWDYFSVLFVSAKMSALQGGKNWASQWGLCALQSKLFSVIFKVWMMVLDCVKTQTGLLNISKTNGKQTSPEIYARYIDEETSNNWDYSSQWLGTSSYDNMNSNVKIILTLQQTLCTGKMEPHQTPSTQIPKTKTTNNQNQNVI